MASRFTVLLLLAIWHAAAGARAGVEMDAVQLDCVNAGECWVDFALDNGQRHRVELVEEIESIFARDAVVSFHDGETPRIPVASRQTFGVRYRSRLSAGATSGASVLLSKDRRQLLAGTFATPQGVVEFGTEHETQTLTRRNLKEVKGDIVLDNPDGMPWMPKNKLQERDPNTLPSAPPGQYIPFFPGCYPGDSVINTVRVNLIYDAGLYNRLTAGVAGDQAAKIDKILSDLETFFGFGKLIYLLQLNLRLEIGRIIFGKGTDPLPLSRGATAACTGAQTTFQEFLRYLNTANAAEPTGYWIFMSNCFSDITGVSYVGTLCGSGNNGGVAKYEWPTVFHELGHGLGAQHSFENGMGLTGGIMDYGDITYNGLVQFHPLKSRDMCPFLSYLRTSTSCPFFKRAEVQVSCGDAILDKSEQCECMRAGSTSCGACVNCRLTDPSIQCSSSDFVVRQPTSLDVIVEPTALAIPECCVRNRLAPPKTLCGSGRLDVCGQGGRCEKVCTKKLESNNPNCGFDATGCLQGCVWEGECRFDIPSYLADGSEELINKVADGTACYINGGSTQGACQRGQCLAIGATLPPSSPPTRRPTWPDVPWTDGSASPTMQPAPSPSPPTRPPVSAATLTRRPTGYPTKKSPPTKRPTPALANRDSARCAKFRAATRCARMRCGWCSSTKRCVAIGDSCA